jgi:RNA polymerase-interacting CarD/CdnL/TRCF family regulator
MAFHEGDMVVHWTYGLGRIVQLEEREVFGSRNLYYAVQIGDMTVWVPENENLDSRLRLPTNRDEFERLLCILSTPGETLPENRNERRTYLLGLLKDGSAESLCYIVRDLDAYQHVHQLNENDQTFMKQARNTLMGEWGFVLSLTQDDVERELRHLLDRKQKSAEQ